MKVLLVDDSEDVLSEISRSIESIKGVEIVGKAPSEEQAKKLFQSEQPDITILDIRLKKGNGINVLKFINKENPSSIVMMLTNYPFHQYKKKCKELGANYFFDKTSEIVQAIHKIKLLNSLFKW